MCMNLITGEKAIILAVDHGNKNEVDFYINEDNHCVDENNVVESQVRGTLDNCGVVEMDFDKHNPNLSTITVKAHFGYEDIVVDAANKICSLRKIPVRFDESDINEDDLISVKYMPMDEKKFKAMRKTLNRPTRGYYETSIVDFEYEKESFELEQKGISRYEYEQNNDDSYYKNTNIKKLSYRR